jgi:Shedu protein SduA, C-terminal
MPKGILLIGNTDQLDDDEKKATFHAFRRNTWDPEVITYDELLERAKFLVARTATLVEQAAAPAEPDVLDPDDGSGSDNGDGPRTDPSSWTTTVHRRRTESRRTRMKRSRLPTTRRRGSAGFSSDGS